MKIFVLAIAMGALPAIALAETAPPAAAPAAVPAPAAAAAAPATPAAPAATVPGEDAVRGKYRLACAADVAKFCADVEKGKGKKRACLESHQSEISAGCKDALAERAAAKAKS